MSALLVSCKCMGTPPLFRMRGSTHTTGSRLNSRLPPLLMWEWVWNSIDEWMGQLICFPFSMIRRLHIGQQYSLNGVGHNNNSYVSFAYKLSRLQHTWPPTTEQVQLHDAVNYANFFYGQFGRLPAWLCLKFVPTLITCVFSGRPLQSSWFLYQYISTQEYKKRLIHSAVVTNWLKYA